MPSYLSPNHKRKAHMIASRLRRFAIAVMGKSELVVGPQSVAALMGDPAYDERRRLEKEQDARRQRLALSGDAAAEAFLDFIEGKACLVIEQCGTPESGPFTTVRFKRG